MIMVDQVDADTHIVVPLDKFPCNDLVVNKRNNNQYTNENSGQWVRKAQHKTQHDHHEQSHEENRQ